MERIKGSLPPTDKSFMEAIDQTGFLPRTNILDKLKFFDSNILN